MVMKGADDTQQGLFSQNGETAARPRARSTARKVAKPLADEAVLDGDGLVFAVPAQGAIEVADDKLRRTDGQLVWVRQPVEVAALVPLEFKMTLLSRRVYHFLLAYSLDANGTLNEHGVTWRVPLRTVLKDIGYNSNNTKELKDSISELQSIKVTWGPSPKDERTGEVREWGSSQLLSSVEFVRDASGTRWLEWSFPAALLRQLREQRPYFAYSLAIMAKLKRYSTMALFLVVMRYKTSPNGLTLRLPWRQFIPLLTGESLEEARLRARVEARGRDSTELIEKYKEWRYFARDVVRACVDELNGVLDDCWVEPVLHKRGRTVEDLQFRVHRRDQYERAAPAKSAPKVQALATKTLVEQGLNQAFAARLCEEHGATVCLDGVANLKARIADVGMPPVQNVPGYLVNEISRLSQERQAPAPSPLPGVLPVLGTAPADAPKASLQVYRKYLEEQAEVAWRETFDDVRRGDLLRIYEELSLRSAPAPVRTAYQKHGIGKTATAARFFAWLAEHLAGPSWNPTVEELLAFHVAMHSKKD
jgi:hypothetical protein